MDSVSIDTFHLHSHEPDGVFLLSFDTIGNVNWMQQIDCQTGRIRSLSTNNHGLLLDAAGVYGDSLFVGDSLLLFPSAINYLLLAYNTNGVLQWMLPVI